MKVTPLSRTNPTYESRGVSQGTEPRPAGAAEQVRISGQAKALSDARAPEVADAEKVARLRDSLSKGTFKVDHEKIADAMLREEQ
jgi:flagellar biosynthesis anti-sigma factor FlgM